MTRYRRQAKVLASMAAIAVSGLVVASALGLSIAKLRADEPAAKKTVKLTIDYGDGVEKTFLMLDWKDKMTVLDLLNQAQRHSRGIRFEFQGNGETGLLTKIDDLKNEGRGRNWIYRVNGKLGDRSFAIYPLDASDVVLWKFAEYK